MIGTTIDQYRIEARLGGGGMGEVFRARDLELDRDVAIKLVRPELSDLEEVTQRFRAEARTLAGLAHTNIATVFRFFAHEGTLYLVMEYISGQPFGDMLRDKGARPPAEVVRMLKQALAGLGYAHDNKVVHRDIKPGNLMLDGHDTVKVLDFGIAHLLDQTRLTQSGSVLGTPAYMAPEQVLGQQVDGRTDLYALGVVLFEMLTGKLPFRANSQFELMRAHLETHPRSLQEMSDTVPRPLQDTVVRALAKDSAERFQSAAEFSAALDGALADALASGDDLSTQVGGGRSPVAVHVGAAQVATEAVDRTVARSDAAAADTEIRMPTSVEIPLPKPKTALGAGIAAVLLVGAGIWWASSGESDPTAVAGGTSAGAAQSPTPTVRRSDATVLENAATGVTTTSGSDAGTGFADTAADTNEGSRGTLSGMSGGDGQGNQPQGAAADSGQTLTQQVGASPSTSVAATSPATSSKPAPAPVVQRAAPRTRTTRFSVQAIKVSAHERQGLGRLSRAAGYNGSFSFSAPSGAAAQQIDELIEVYRDGRQLSRQLIHSQTRKPGRFKTKQRIPGLKELNPGSYTLRLVFESGGRSLGRHEWELIVGS